MKRKFETVGFHYDDVIDLTAEEYGGGKEEEEDEDDIIITPTPPTEAWIKLFEWIYENKFACKPFEDITSAGQFFNPVSISVHTRISWCSFGLYHEWEVPLDHQFGRLESDKQRVYGVRAPGTFPIEVCVPCLLRLFQTKKGWRLMSLENMMMFDPDLVYPSTIPWSCLSPHNLISAYNRQVVNRPITCPELPDFPSCVTKCSSVTIKLRIWTRRCCSENGNYQEEGGKFPLVVCWKLYSQVSRVPNLRRSVWLCEQCFGIALALGPPFFFLSLTN